jgi:hypothetical protein
MPAYAVRLLDAARDDIAALDRSVATRIVSRLRWLAESGAEMRSDALKGDLAGLVDNEAVGRRGSSCYRPPHSSTPGHIRSRAIWP